LDTGGGTGADEDVTSDGLLLTDAAADAADAGAADAGAADAGAADAGADAAGCCERFNRREGFPPGLAPEAPVGPAGPVGGLSDML
jgi:maltooligosyltrehalose trehalohydrolase